MRQMLTDDDVWGTSYATVVEAMRRAIDEQGAGTLVAPPRWRIDAGDGDLVFTAGTAKAAGVTGFRAYETFPHHTEDHQAITAVWDAADGRFRGLVIGHALGILRTGGLGGVAVDLLSRADATEIAVLGAGPHARAQLEATAAVRDLETVAVYSPTPSSRERFASTLEDRLDATVAAVGNAKAAIDGADVVLCATDSETPVFDADDLEAGAHVTTLGPKSVDGHEIPDAIVDDADVLATDSRTQVVEYDRPIVPADELVELGDVAVGNSAGRTAADDLTVYLSVGLAGTEVVLAGELLDG